MTHPTAHTETRAKNHLAGATSPYLLQHVYNPVDWYSWGEAALAKAREEDKPIFLSIGYSACHWCHVMERESFEDEKTAAILNKHFVSIKVDREERPDLDEIYMAAVMSMTGAGGWPMTVFLTPQLEPFYGGTYFPPVDMYGRPGFKTVLRGVAEAWHERRDEVMNSANRLTAHIERITASPAGPRKKITPDLFREATGQLSASFDGAQGGWGAAPKFPSSGAIMLLLRQHRASGGDDLLHMATFTLDKMANGGIYDHLGGGFHRYSVDAQWLVPHFEKMLYDNAQLAQAYTEAFQLTGDPSFRRVACETLDYLLRDMRDPAGGFHSAEDADSEGEEGRFYVWTPAQIREVLGSEDAAFFCGHYNVREEGNFDSHEAYHAGKSILHLSERLDEGTNARLAPLRDKLREARATRVRPGLDDKVLTSWNALAVSALAQAARAFDEPRYAEAAVDAGRFILDNMVKDGGLLRTYRDGESRLPGYLDDYAFTMNAFVDLYEATFDRDWLDEAARLAEALLARFWDESGGRFFFTSSAHTNLIVRTAPSFDGAEPSGNSIAALGLQRLAHHLERTQYQEAAEKLLETHAERMRATPQGFLRMLCAADFKVYPPLEIALAGHEDSPGFDGLLRTVYNRFLPNRVVAGGVPSNGGALPLLKDRPMVDGKAAAYVCRDRVCGAPAATPEALAEQLDALAPGATR